MEKARDGRMNWQGWIFICLAWGFISIIFFYSFYRILFDERVLSKKGKNQPDNKRVHRKSKVHKKNENGTSQFTI